MNKLHVVQHYFIVLALTLILEGEKEEEGGDTTHQLWEGEMLRGVTFSGSLVFLIFTCGCS